MFISTFESEKGSTYVHSIGNYIMLGNEMIQISELKLDPLKYDAGIE